MPWLCVAENELRVSSDGTVMLRAATGESSSGEDISSEISVILLDAESNTVFSGSGGQSQLVPPLDSVTYIAES